MNKVFPDKNLLRQALMYKLFRIHALTLSNK